jgi:DNA-binding SARP family transcriptional activator
MRQGDKDRRRGHDRMALTSDICPASSSPILRVRTLGHTAVMHEGTDLSGPWLRQRAGRVFKYLVVNRRRTVSLEEIVDLFWAGRSGGVRSARQAVHLLRGSLEPGKAPGAPSSFIRSTGGGYAIDLATVRVDIDEFEAAAYAGFGRPGLGTPVDPFALQQAVRLYGGELFPDEPYAEWVLSERDRLHDLAATVLRRLVELRPADGTGEDGDAGLGPLAQLADLEPFDLDVQRSFIQTLVSHGRWSQAVRRATATTARFERVFGERPDLPVERP